MAQPKHELALQIDGRGVVITSPGKLLIPAAGITKFDLVHYFMAVAEGILRGAGGRPCVLVRYPNGIGEELRVAFAAACPSGTGRGSTWRT